MRTALICLLVLSGCTQRNLIPPRDGALPDPDAGTDGGPPRDGGPRLDDVLIYAHSRDTLFTFSPFTLQVQSVGQFHRANGSTDNLFMLDLAVNAANEVYTSSDDSLYRVDPTNAQVTLVGEFDFTGGERLFALTFLAPGEYRTDRETLIGATNEGAYYEVDLRDASTRFLGMYPTGWASSGDIVSVQGLGTFATLRDTRPESDPERFDADVLGRILFSSDGSSTVVVVGPVRDASNDYTELFGLGYWGRVLFGFSNDGQLIEIDRMTGAGRVATAQTGTSQFWGAGVTTQVPVLF
jgi:hypothetical protein